MDLKLYFQIEKYMNDNTWGFRTRLDSLNDALRIVARNLDVSFEEVVGPYMDTDRFVSACTCDWNEYLV